VPTTVQLSDTAPRSTPEAIWPLLMSQIVKSPVEVLRQRISVLPSPLKSPVPA
jgi:hypothetical protein